MKTIRFILLSVLSLMISSCLIENDMSYPADEAMIISMAVEGQEEVIIDQESHSVRIVLEETADMSFIWN